VIVISFLYSCKVIDIACIIASVPRGIHANQLSELLLVDCVCSAVYSQVDGRIQCWHSVNIQGGPKKPDLFEH